MIGRRNLAFIACGIIERDAANLGGPAYRRMENDLGNIDAAELARLLFGKSPSLAQKRPAFLSGFDQREHVSEWLAADRLRDLAQIENDLLIGRKSDAVAFLPAKAQEFQVCFLPAYALKKTMGKGPI